MGEGGVQPHYFLYEMEFWECQYFIDGYNRRFRPQYNMFRWLIHSIASMFCGKGKIPDDPVKFCPFEWEKETSEETIHQDEAALQELIDSLNQHNQAIDQVANG